MSYSVQNKEPQLEINDETDSGVASSTAHLKNCENDSMNSSNSLMYYHIPSLCDMLIGFPTQKGFIAYRKPEIGSWYMNAIVQIFSKHACDTDLCAMLNMVNQMISNEVTNMGKKQMSEFTSKLTKPYFYFFPGLASENSDEDASNEEVLQSNYSSLQKSSDSLDDLCNFCLNFSNFNIIINLFSF